MCDVEILEKRWIFFNPSICVFNLFVYFFLALYCACVWGYFFSNLDFGYVIEEGFWMLSFILATRERNSRWYILMFFEIELYIWRKFLSYIIKQFTIKLLF